MASPADAQRTDVRTKETVQRATLLAAVLASFAAYHGLNVHREPLHILALPIDAAIPMIPALSVPYLLYIPFLFFTAAHGVMATKEWKRVGASFIIVQLVACAIYYSYQTHVPRPAIAGDDVFSDLVRFIYSSDRPYNTFPSLHVAHSTVALYWWRRSYRRWFPAAAILTALIYVATVSLKQHYVVDVPSGALLAVAGIWAARLAFPDKTEKKPTGGTADQGKTSQ